MEIMFPLASIRGFITGVETLGVGLDVFENWLKRGRGRGLNLGFLFDWEGVFHFLFFPVGHALPRIVVIVRSTFFLSLNAFGIFSFCSIKWYQVL